MSLTSESPTKPLSDVDLHAFEQIIAQFDEPVKCEGTHNKSVCDGSATFRLKSCRTSFVCCATFMQRKIIQMSTGRLCSGCMEPSAECWTIRPL